MLFAREFELIEKMLGRLAAANMKLVDGCQVIYRHGIDRFAELFNSATDCRGQVAMRVVSCDFLLSRHHRLRDKMTSKISHAEKCVSGQMRERFGGEAGYAGRPDQLLKRYLAEFAVGKACLFQVEIALDSPSRFVGDLAVA